MSNQRKNDEYWMNLINRCRTSGLSDAQWCKDNGINPSTFYYHIKRLRENACTIPVSARAETADRHEVIQIFDRGCAVTDTGSHSVSVPASGIQDFQPDTETAIRLEYHGIHMEITNSARSSVIADTIRVLQELC